MKKAIVIREYQSEYTTPFVVKAGEILERKEKESEWEGWVWCRNRDGLYRWYPRDYLKEITRKPNHFELLRDYNAKEIPVQVGEEVTILFEESSWAWVILENRDEGWIPLEHLEVINQ